MKPLFELIKDKEKCVRFHTPGHSGKSPDGIYDELYSAAVFDVTELPYSDNLLNGTGAIKQLEERAAKIYGAQTSFIFTAGATSAVFCAVFTAAALPGAFMVLGGAHKSVYNALRLAGRKAFQAPLDMDIDSLAEQIAKRKISAVILTSPDYRGRIRERGICEKLKTLFPYLCLIVDASHGAHYAFSKLLPKAVPECADLVIHSPHKMLPVFTGGAILHAKEKYAQKVKLYRSMLHTSSPSYPVILSIEAALDYYAKKGEEIFQKIKDASSGFKRALPPGFIAEECEDFSRSVIGLPYYDGREAYAALAEKGFYAEAASEDTVIFILTQNNIEALPSLGKALFEIAPTLSQRADKPRADFAPKRIFRLKFYKDFQLIDISECEGKISYREIGLYPPGTPTVFSGQKITQKQARFISEHASELFGLVNGKVCVVK
ncbi:MAG: hypothetical protein ACOYIQ_06620 [Christensenellales bacterium]|jgi:arginine decarboxylase